MEIALDNISFNFDPKVFWGVVILLAFAGIAQLTLILANLISPKSDWLARQKGRLGLGDLSSVLFIFGGLLWITVFLLLSFGLIWMIWEVIWVIVPEKTDNQDATWDWRFSLVKLTALTATLGAVVALPVTLQRLRLTRQQNDLSAEALFNDKINAAANDLHARRLVTKNPDDGGDHWDFWQDDIIKRNAAIDRLEGLVRENPETAERIARLLGIYVRELSREHKPIAAPDGATPDELREWAGKLDACRSDMENAAQTLGRLRGIDGVEAAKVPVDLRRANLQGFDLRGADFDQAQLDGVKMQGANLIGAQMQGADLITAEMQGANLNRAQMRGTDLFGTKMQGADLRGAQMQGVNFFQAEMDSATFLRAATFQAAALKAVDYRDVNISQAQVDELFYDGSVMFAPDITRAAGREEVLDWEAFITQWRAWRKKIGYDPDAADG